MIMLMDDTPGKVHQTRALGKEAHVAIVIPVRECRRIKARPLFSPPPLERGRVREPMPARATLRSPPPFPTGEG